MPEAEITVWEDKVLTGGLARFWTLWLRRSAVAGVAKRDLFISLA